MSYPTNGRKVLALTVRFADGSSAQARAALYVKVPTVNYRSVPVTLANLGTVEAKFLFATIIRLWNCTEVVKYWRYCTTSQRKMNTTTPGPLSCGDR